MFAKLDGTVTHPDAVAPRFANAVKRLGLPPLTFHGLRHSHATMGLRLGIHPKTMQERLGHATIAMTMDTYSPAIPALQSEAAAKIGELVFGEKLDS